jgi:RNA polymerase sigma-70 factor (ECF subfamily)
MQSESTGRRERGKALLTRDAEDSVLIERVRQRQPDALLALYRKYKGRVFSLVFRIAGDRGAAEEILQDTFFRLWERPQFYDPEKGPLVAWLLTVGRNLALDHKRKESRRVQSCVITSEGTSFLERVPEMAALEDPSLAPALRQAMKLLPPNQRTAIELAYFEGLTHSELAERLGESLGTIKTRIRLGLSKMRETMRDFGKVLTR